MKRNVQIKIEQIARMRVKGIPATRICIEMGMSYGGIMNILRHPDYLNIEEGVRKGVINTMDARLAKRASLELDIEDAVPDALSVVLDQVRKKRDLRAALEVLDRDPMKQFAKSGSKPLTPQTNDPSAISSEALAQAVKEADITHTIMQKPQPQPVAEVFVDAKGGEA